VFELATGYGLDDEILRTYRFIAENYHPEGDWYERQRSTVDWH
jgi:hypothetical protein